MAPDNAKGYPGALIYKQITISQADDTTAVTIQCVGHLQDQTPVVVDIMIEDLTHVKFKTLVLDTGETAISQDGVITLVESAGFHRVYFEVTWDTTNGHVN
jgi:hypothetical protein